MNPYTKTTQDRWDIKETRGLGLALTLFGVFVSSFLFLHVCLCRLLVKIDILCNTANKRVSQVNVCSCTADTPLFPHFLYFHATTIRNTLNVMYMYSVGERSLADVYTWNPQFTDTDTLGMNYRSNPVLRVQLKSQCVTFEWENVT